MNYSRSILYAGVFFLTAGGAARYSGAGFAPFLFSIGGLCKITYLIILIKSRKYRPGYEVLFLISGLAILYTGILIRHYPVYAGYSPYVITSAIFLKLIFVLFVIKKIRSDKTSKAEP